MIRYGLDAMFDIQWGLWSETVLPAVRDLKARWMKVGDGTVEAFMKDIQVDASAFPGKEFDLTFEMPEPDVGIMTFNKCSGPMSGNESAARTSRKVRSRDLSRFDDETAKLYNPNMKMDVLAIPPRVRGHVCCRWRLSIRDESDPDYVPGPIDQEVLSIVVPLSNGVGCRCPPD